MLSTACSCNVPVWWVSNSIPAEGWAVCLVTVHHWLQKWGAGKRGDWFGNRVGETEPPQEKKKELAAYKSSRSGPQLSARAPGQASIIATTVQDTAPCLCSSGKLYLLLSEFTILLAGVFSDSCNCAVLELPLTQSSPPTHSCPALLLQQAPSNVFLRRHSP